MSDGTVEQQIFACMKFSRISRISADSRIFPAREYYQYTVLVLSFHQAFTEWKSEFDKQGLILKLRTPLYPQIREIFLSRTCLARDFAKLTCREIFLFYSTSLS